MPCCQGRGTLEPGGHIIYVPPFSYCEPSSPTAWSLLSPHQPVPLALTDRSHCRERAGDGVKHHLERLISLFCPAGRTRHGPSRPKISCLGEGQWLSWRCKHLCLEVHQPDQLTLSASGYKQQPELCPTASPMCPQHQAHGADQILLSTGFRPCLLF